MASLDNSLRGPRAGTFHLDKRAGSLIEYGSGDPQVLLTTKALAAWLGVSVQFLELARQRGNGPKFLRITERAIRYRRSDVLTWLAERERLSTREGDQ